MRDVCEINQAKTGASVTENKGIQARYERYRGIIKNLTIMDDIFMRNVFQNRECVEYVLQVILDQPDLTVVEQVIQKDYKNLQGRSAILDCVVRDSSNRSFDVEIQQEKEGASPKRARYYSGLMDMNLLEPGQSYDELPECYVIFITIEDVLGYGCPIYHINRVNRETGEVFPDGSHIIYVNSRIQDDTKLGSLMHDLNCKDAEGMYSRVLAKRVRELKETKEGIKDMCYEIDEIYQEGKLEGRREGKIEGKLEGKLEGKIEGKMELVKSMAERGMTAEQIAEMIPEDLDQIREWIAE